MSEAIDRPNHAMAATAVFVAVDALSRCHMYLTQDELGATSLNYALHEISLAIDRATKALAILSKEKSRRNDAIAQDASKLLDVAWKTRR